jgi:tetratricopeptide (TPR) repeat protein
LRNENDVDAARPLLKAAVARARRRGEEGWLPAGLVRLALLEWAAGNRTESDRYLAEAAEAARQQLDDEIDSWVVHADGQLAASRGQLERARSCADEVLRLSKANHDLRLQRDGDVLLAEVELLSGQPGAAHNRLERRRERAIASGPFFLGFITLSLWSPDIEALIALGRLREAQQVLDNLLDRALRYPNPHAMAIAKRCEGAAARGPWSVLKIRSRAQLAAVLAARTLTDSPSPHPDKAPVSVSDETVGRPANLT